MTHRLFPLSPTSNLGFFKKTDYRYVDKMWIFLKKRQKNLDEHQRNRDPRGQRSGMVQPVHHPECYQKSHNS
jgi:hypothetical protein